MIHKGHWYDESGKLTTPLTPGAVPSATTVLSVIANPGLEAWRLRVGTLAANEKQTTSAARGTAVHKLLEDIVNNKTISKDHIYAKEGQSYVNWRTKHEPAECEAEVFLRSEDFGYAGTADLICRLDGELWVIDFKTSRLISPTFGLQLRAYEQGLFEIRHEHARMGVLQITDQVKAGYRFHEVNEPLDVFLACKRLFDWNRKFNAEVFDGRFIRTA